MDPTGTPTAITIPSIVSTADSASAGQDSESEQTQIQLVQLLKLHYDFTGTIKAATHMLTNIVGR